MILINSVPFEPHPDIGFSDSPKGLNYAHNYPQRMEDVKNKRFARLMFGKDIIKGDKLTEDEERQLQIAGQQEKTNPGTLETSMLRYLIQNDLWFLLYFVVKPFKDEKTMAMVNHPFVVRVCQEVEQGPIDYTLDVWAREHFKALDLNTAVPTTSGWKKHGDLKPGDYVFHPNGQPTRVIAKTEVFATADCYKIKFDDGFEIVASGDHFWTVRRRSRRRVSGTKNKRLPFDELIISTRDLSLHNHLPDNRFWIPCCEPIEYSKKILPIDPYVLGAWLGDGTASNGGFTCADEQVYGEIKDAGYSVSKGRPSKDITKTIYGLQPELRKFNLLRNKYIPTLYLRGSKEQRLALLQGLMDTDGNSHKDHGQVTFVNKNEQLALDCFELTLSLGIKAHFSDRTYDSTGRVFYVSFEGYKLQKPFRLKRKLENLKTGSPRSKRYIVSIEQIGSIPVSCIQVESPDGQYIAGDHFVATHNSSIFTIAETIQYELKNPECCTGIFSYIAPKAKDFLFSIKSILERETILYVTHPDVIWKDKRESPLWSLDEGIVLKRKTNRQEPSIGAYGLVEGMPTGMHFERRVYDDVVTEDIGQSFDTMEKIKTKFDSSQNIGQDGGHHRVIGTFYHHSDPLVYIRDQKELDKEGVEKPLYLLRLKPATDNGIATGKPILISQERLDKLKSTRTFACQQLCDPTPQADQRLNPDYFQQIEEKLIPRTLYHFITVDQAGDEGSNKTRDGDAWAVGVFGVEPYSDEIGQSKIFIRDLWIDQAGESEAIDRIVRMYVNAPIISLMGVEKVGLSTTHLHIEKALRARGRSMDFSDDSRKTNGVLLRPAGRTKKKFIEAALAWPLNNSKWFYSSQVPTSYIDRLKMEMRNHPLWHDDGLNACAYLYDLIKDYRFSRKESEIEQWRRKKQEREQEEYNPLTFRFAGEM